MITIIGYGNPLRCDDGVGWVILDELIKLYSEQLNISGDTNNTQSIVGNTHNICDISKDNNDANSILFIKRQQLDVVDMEAVSDSCAVIFIDAHVNEDMNDIFLKELFALNNFILNGAHISSPEEFISFTKQVFGSHPPAYLFAVRGYDFGFGTDISNRTLPLTKIAIKYIDQLIKILLK